VKLSLREVARHIDAVGTFDGNAIAQAYSIDSRTIRPSELFFAVQGERLDGHDYVETALKQGAVAAVIDGQRQDRYADQSRLLVVEDTLAALQALATAVRRSWAKRLIAITGSAGKTTTKEAIAGVLSTRMRVLKSQGNFNNHFGLPLNLLRLEPEDQIAVIEMGMSHAGEITALARIAEPNVGVVTNVAPVHLEFFDSIAGIARAKYELIQSLPPTGTAILNVDDEYVSQFGRDFAGKVVMYGIKHPADIRAEGVRDLGRNGSDLTIVAHGAVTCAHLPLLGRHNVYNALAAVAVALENGFSLEQAAVAIGTLRPAEKRGEMLSVYGASVINDCYNSNPKALESMVDTLAGMTPGQNGRRIVVAGEMLELGPSADALHRRAGEHMAGRVQMLVGVRGAAQYMVEEAKRAGVEAIFIQTPEEAGAWLAREVHSGDIVLLKASRGVRLERALEVWKGSTAAETAH